MKRIILLALATLLVVAGAVPAAAVTRGTPDNGAHPMVGQLFFHVPDDPDPRFDDPGAWYSCTGTLISPTVVLTAGHCTFGIGRGGASTLNPQDRGEGGTDVWITFEELPTLDAILEPSGTFATNDERYAVWSAALEGDDTWHRGTATPHPAYDPASFVMADLGVVVLDEPVSTEVVGEYGQLPEVGYLDEVLASKTHDKLFTPVGYGVQAMVPVYDPGGTREYSTSKLIDLRGTHGIPAGVAAKFSNNNGKKHTGGACGGDSGGPLFDASRDDFLIGAITSYGISPCVGTDGAYRIDKVGDLAWIEGMVDAAA